MRHSLRAGVGAGALLAALAAAPTSAQEAQPSQDALERFVLVDDTWAAFLAGRLQLDEVVELVRNEGATELLTSHVVGEGSPAGFYAKLGFEPTGELDPEGEVILRLALH